MLVGQKIIIFNDKNEILLLQRSNKSGLGGKWSFPGGALERGESSKESILREVKEETNIYIKEPTPFYVKTYISKSEDSVVIIAYEATYEKGKIGLNWEHDNYRWLSKGEALHMDLTPDAKDILSHWKPYMRLLQ